MALLLSAAGCLLALVFASIFVADGTLIYSLDDPYIHLALAKTIQQGSYGINVSEWSSPSSSVIWPFMMALWPTHMLEIAPLIVNAVFCLLTVMILREVLRGPLVPERYQVLATIVLAFGLNTFGLVMTGMEHSLQLLLAVFVAWRLTTNKLDWLFYLALVLMPLVRYECMALTAPVAAYLLFTQGKIKPSIAVAASVAGLVAFSFFLHSKGLPWLPTSVMAKNADRMIWLNLILNPAFYVLLWWLNHAYKEERLKFWLWFALPLAAFLLVGRSGWFGRYEAFMVGWLAVFALYKAQTVTLPPPKKPTQRTPLERTQTFFKRLALAFPALWLCTVLSPWASANIARQQVVMAEIARQVGKPVAVNDLGLVALRSGQFVLDLWGLGSVEALNLRLYGTKPIDVWMDELVQAKHVPYAFIYESPIWFPKRPASWVKVGELVLNVQQIIVGSTKVALFATTPEAAPALREVLVRMKADPKVLAQIDIMPVEAVPAK
jgi:hypothetical protein